MFRPSNLDIRIDAYPVGSAGIETIPKVKVKIEKVKLHCPVAEMNPKIYNKFEQKLVHKAVKLSFRRYVVNAMAISAQTTNWPSPMVYQNGPFPARVFIGKSLLFAI